MSISVILQSTSPKDGSPVTMTFDRAVRVTSFPSYIFLYDNEGKEVAGFATSQIVGWEVK